MKKCGTKNGCGKMLPEPEFWKNQGMCKACSKKAHEKYLKDHPGYDSATSKHYRKKHPERVKETNKKNHSQYKERYPERFKKMMYKSGRKWFLRKVYGITLAEYERMFLSQGGVCAICGKPETQKNRKVLCVDHDHETGEVRGLLCNNCNRVLGMLDDDMEVLEKALTYLRSHQESIEQEVL